MEKHLGWAHKLGGVEPLWISKVGLTVLARLMESQLWHQPTSSVGGGLCLPWCQTFQSLPVYHWSPSRCCLRAGTQRELVWEGESMCGFPKMNCLGLQQHPPLTQSLLVVGTYLPGTRILGWGPGVGLGLLTHEIHFPNFSLHGCGASPFRVRTPPTSLDGCGFFNSIVVRFHWTWFLMFLSDGCSIF